VADAEEGGDEIDTRKAISNIALIGGSGNDVVMGGDGNDNETGSARNALGGNIELFADVAKEVFQVSRVKGRDSY
jgi:Ca2+-binding RTX toxin-like protein